MASATRSPDDARGGGRGHGDLDAVEGLGCTFAGSSPPEVAGRYICSCGPSGRRHVFRRGRGRADAAATPRCGQVKSWGDDASGRLRRRRVVRRGRALSRRVSDPIFIIIARESRRFGPSREDDDAAADAADGSTDGNAIQHRRLGVRDWIGEDWDEPMGARCVLGFAPVTTWMRARATRAVRRLQGGDLEADGGGRSRLSGRNAY